MIYDWPTDSSLTLGAPTVTAGTTISLLGYVGEFSFSAKPEGGVVIKIPPIPANKMPCQWAWTFKFTKLENWQPNISPVSIIIN